MNIAPTAGVGVQREGSLCSKYSCDSRNSNNVKGVRRSKTKNLTKSQTGPSKKEIMPSRFNLTAIKRIGNCLHAHKDSQCESFSF